MVLAAAQRLAFFPPTGPASTAEKAGFRSGDKGTHSSRTLMLGELEAVLAAVPLAGSRGAYVDAIVAGNCLEKPTASTRRASSQRLAELYALDPACPLFRALRRLWDLDPRARPLLAMLAALARDPLFLASAAPILALPAGAEMPRGPLRDALRKLVGERMNDAVLDKVVRNVASSWAQAGHLQGRTFKVRRHVQPQPASVAFALYLGHCAGFRSEELFANGWVVALDSTPSSVRSLALEARRLGLLDLQIAGDVVEIGLERLDARLESPLARPLPPMSAAPSRTWSP